VAGQRARPLIPDPPHILDMVTWQANVSALSYNGKTALEIATINKSKPELIELLKAHS
jgi:hypothetical protein